MTPTSAILLIVGLVLLVASIIGASIVIAGGLVGASIIIGALLHGGFDREAIESLLLWMDGRPPP